MAPRQARRLATQWAAIAARSLALALGLFPGWAGAADVRGSDAVGTAAAKPAPWALAPLNSPPVPRPEPGAGVPAGNPIDAFIRQSLEARGWRGTPEADRSTLARRLYFDLTGLPPTPEQVREFLQDTAADAYEKLVDRLLGSPRHGERWARHWMDAVHFAETHGHDQDRVRENAWPYRDYLIASFNGDKPYARFVQEQVAGDVLFPDDPEATVALGFLAAGPWDESSLRDIREDSIDREIGRYLDRDDMVTTVMQTFTSTTVQCARCHDHKFDPIRQDDYYALQAAFAGVERANRVYDKDPAVARQRRELKARLAAVEKGDQAVLLSADSRQAVAAWEAAQSAAVTAWSTLEPNSIVSSAGAVFARQGDGSYLASGTHGPKDTYTVSVNSVNLPRITAVRLEVLTDDSLPMRGPGREPNGNLHLSEFELLARHPGEPAGRRVALRDPVADFNQDGWTIAHALDGVEKTAWGIHPREGQAHAAIFSLAEPLASVEGLELTIVLRQLHGGHCIGRLRLAVTAMDPAQCRVAIQPMPEPVRAVVATPASQRSDAQWAVIAGHVLRQNLANALGSLAPPALVYAAASDFVPDGSHKPPGRPRSVRVLKRGDIHLPGAEATPGALSCIPALPARFEVAERDNEGLRRAALARWLTDRDNPLTWRSIVNRVWHHHFGRGLVETLNDFGGMGSAPSHPELLDWLAVWFRDDARGSLKRLHRLIVTSATYRQSSMVSSTGSAGSSAAASSPRSLDAENRFLARMNRTRLDAEQIRDAVLQIAGRMELRMGGPSDRLFELRPGVHVTPVVDYSKFAPDAEQGRRRSVYRFLFRTLPDPFMDALDCPAGDQLTPARTAGVTVQQALALWNNTFIARQVEHLAARLERESGDLDGRVRRAFELILSRAPTDAERREFGDYARRHGLANLGRVLFNSNEFLFVN